MCTDDMKNLHITCTEIPCTKEVEVDACANCGKEGEEASMNACNKCDLVVYCNVLCKKRHRSKHKKKCEKRVAELYDKKLFKEPPPPEDCPICFLPLPLDAYKVIYKSCCGKDICNGCVGTMMESGDKNMKLCPFCKTPSAISEEEEVERTEKLTEKGNAQAFYMLASCYAQGINGMPQDRAKVNELLLKSGELGCADAYYNLGNFYNKGDGVEIDMKKANVLYIIHSLPKCV